MRIHHHHFPLDFCRSDDSELAALFCALKGWGSISPPWSFKKNPAFIQGRTCFSGLTEVEEKKSLPEKMTHQRDARKCCSLAVYFPLLLGRRVRTRCCNVASASGCQRGQRALGLSVTVSLSTEALTLLLGAGGDAQIASVATARQESSSRSIWHGGQGPRGLQEQNRVRAGNR